MNPQLTGLELQFLNLTVLQLFDASLIQHTCIKRLNYLLDMSTCFQKAWSLNIHLFHDCMVVQ